MPSNSPLPFYFIILEFLLLIILIVSMWKVFVKAGKPGWAVLIPGYNVYALFKIAGRPGWWLILLFIPIVNLVIELIVSASVAKMFGRSTLFGVIMLGFFSFIGYPILGFGKSQYVGVNTQINQPPLTVGGNVNLNQQFQPVQNEIPATQPNSLPQPIVQQSLSQQPPIQQNPIPQQAINEIPPSGNKV